MNTFVPVFFLNKDTKAKLGIGRVEDRTESVYCHPFELNGKDIIKDSMVLYQKKKLWVKEKYAHINHIYPPSKSRFT